MDLSNTILQMKRLFLVFTLPVLLTPLFAWGQSAVSIEEIQVNQINESDIVAIDTVSTPVTWSFSQCLERGIAHSTDVRQSLLSILQADENVGAAKDAWLPQVGFNTSHSFFNYPSPSEAVKGNAYNSSYGIDASWTVWEGNVRKYRLESAKMLRSQSVLAGEEAVKNLTLGVLQAYLNILYAREAVEIARLTLEVSESQTQRAHGLMEAGRTSKVEYAQIESQKAQDVYAVVQAEANLATAVLDLRKLLNVGIDVPLDVAQINFSDSDVSMPLPDSREVYKFASSWLPEIASNELNRDIYANDIKIAQTGYLPSISLQGGLGTGYITGGRSWTSQMGHGFNENVGVSVSVPIYDGNSTRRAVAKAKLAALQYDIDHDRLDDQLIQTIETLYIDARSAREKYAAGVSRLESAQLTSNLVDRQFELGLVNPLDLLTAHNNLLTARLEQLQNKFMAILANKTIEFYATRNVAMP